MAETERNEMIEWLVVVTSWNRSIFENMTDIDLENIYRERVTDR